MDKIVDINVSQIIKSVSFDVTSNLITINVNKVLGGLSAVTSVNGMVGDIIGIATEDYVDNQDALRVPYTGATSDVNLGEFGVQLGNLEFDLTPTNAPTTVGSMSWNDADGTVDLRLKGGNVTLQLGQETVARIVNKTATNITLSEGNYQAVRVTGAQGQRPKVDLAQANNDLNSTTTLGLVTETILNNEEGFITTSGQVRGINTTGSLQGETWSDGDILYLSGTVAGRITNIKPIAPIHTVIIGFVEHAHITQGKIFVKVDNGYELDELHNVSAIAPNNNEVLTYDLATTLWKPKTVGTALGYIPSDDSLVVHLDGTEIITGSKSFSNPIIASSETASTLASFDVSKNIKSLSTTTYPSLSEIAFVKGVTSSIQTQINAKAPIASPTFTGTVSGITKSMVGLGNVDNTTDLLKPISTATQTALNLKSNIASPTFTGIVTTPSIIVSSETASTLASFNSSKNVVSLPLASYPSLSEIAFVKGVTSSVQPQIDSVDLSLNYLDSDNLSFNAFYLRTIADGGIFESSNQLLSTMASLTSVSYVSDGITRQINADKFVKLGGQTGEYLMANGLSLSNVATNATTTALSLIVLNNTYPLAIIGFRVHCIEITAGKLTYEKTSTGWISYSINIVI